MRIPLGLIVVLVGIVLFVFGVAASESVGSSEPRSRAPGRRKSPRRVESAAPGRWPAGERTPRDRPSGPWRSGSETARDGRLARRLYTRGCGFREGCADVRGFQDRWTREVRQLPWVLIPSTHPPGSLNVVSFSNGSALGLMSIVTVLDCSMSPVRSLPRRSDARIAFSSSSQPEGDL